MKASLINCLLLAGLWIGAAPGQDLPKKACPYVDSQLRDLPLARSITLKLSHYAHGAVFTVGDCPDLAVPLLASGERVADGVVEMLLALAESYDIEIAATGKFEAASGFRTWGVAGSRQGNGFGYKGLHEFGFRAAEIQSIRLVLRGGGGGSGVKNP